VFDSRCAHPQTVHPVSHVVSHPAAKPPTIQRRGFLRTYIVDADGVAHGPFWSARAARAWLNEREEMAL
jgi:hypothetical protein